MLLPPSVQPAASRQPLPRPVTVVVAEMWDWAMVLGTQGSCPVLCPDPMLADLLLGAQLRFWA